MHMFELPPVAFSRAAPIFAGTWFNRAYIDAVFEGSQEGCTFVDYARGTTRAISHGIWFAAPPNHAQDATIGRSAAV